MHKENSNKIHAEKLTVADQGLLVSANAGEHATKQNVVHHDNENNGVPRRLALQVRHAMLVATLVCGKPGL
jgi:hypothetical protein